MRHETTLDPHPNNEQKSLLVSSIQSTTDDDHHRYKLKPATKSLISAVCYNLFGITGFTICIPSSKRYMSSFGNESHSIPDSLAGILVGMYPLLSAMTQVALIPILKKYPLRTVYLTCCVFQMVGWVLYALSPAIGHYEVALASRALMGMAAGPLGSYYIARAVHSSVRSRYMMMFSAVLALGYFLGPALGVVLEHLFRNVVFYHPVLNRNTVPGWLMAVLFMVEMALVVVFFVEPPLLPHHRAVKEERMVTLSTSSSSSSFVNAPSGTVCRAEHQKQVDGVTKKINTVDFLPVPSPHQPSLLAKNVAFIYLLNFLLTMNAETWEVETVFIGTDMWGWSIESTAAYLSVFNLISALFSLSGMDHHCFRTNGHAVTCSFVGTLIGSLFFFQYRGASSMNNNSRVSIYSGGSVFVVVAAVMGRGRLFDLASKVSSPERRQATMSLHSAVAMLGRAAGAILSPYLAHGNQTYGLFMTVLNVFGFVVVLVGYQLFELKCGDQKPTMHKSGNIGSFNNSYNKGFEFPSSRVQ